MNAVPLFHSDGKEAGIFYCGKCRTVSRTENEANQCCDQYPCETCGGERPYGYPGICHECSEKAFLIAETKREAERFEASRKIKEWIGPVYLPMSDTYFGTVSDLFDYFANNGGVFPEYVWTCETSLVCHLDYDSIIEDATQEAHENFSPDDLSGELELKSAINVINESNKDLVNWIPNFNVALILERKP